MLYPWPLQLWKQPKSGLVEQGSHDNRRSACRRGSSGDLGQPLTQQQQHQCRRERQERQARSAAKKRLERDELLKRNSRGSRPPEGGGKVPGSVRRNGSDLFDQPAGEAQRMSVDRLGAWQTIRMPGPGLRIQ